MTTWKEWLADIRAKSEMQARGVPVSTVDPWGLQDDGEYFGRPDKRFFALVGVSVEWGPRAWDQVLLKEAGGPGVVILAHRRTKTSSSGDVYENHYLISAKADPGNAAPGCILLAPTLQASKENLEGHGVRPVPHGDLYELAKNDGLVTLAMDGSRYLGKNNHFAVVTVSEDYEPANQSLRWMTRNELQEALHEGCVNTYLRDCLLLAWSTAQTE